MPVWSARTHLCCRPKFGHWRKHKHDPSHARYFMSHLGSTLVTILVLLIGLAMFGAVFAIAWHRMRHGVWLGDPVAFIVGAAMVASGLWWSIMHLLT